MEPRNGIVEVDDLSKLLNANLVALNGEALARSLVCLYPVLSCNALRATHAPRPLTLKWKIIVHLAAPKDRVIQAELPHKVKYLLGKVPSN